MTMDVNEHEGLFNAMTQINAKEQHFFTVLFHNHSRVFNDA
jgi:hypothetical protein